jgi:hypothetical protein
MTLTSLRKLAKSRGCKVRVARSMGGWFAYTYTPMDSRFQDPDIEAQHPSKDVAIRMLAMGLRAMPRGKR